MKDPTGEAGVLFQKDLSGNAGMAAGFAGQGSVGVAYVWGDSATDPTEFGSYVSYGGLVGGALHATTLEGSQSPSNHSVFGLSGGQGYSIGLTNATRVSQLGGINVTNNVSLGRLSFSWSRDQKSGVWTVTMSIGGKAGLSYSSYPTDTKTSTIVTTEKKTDKKQ